MNFASTRSPSRKFTYLSATRHDVDGTENSRATREAPANEDEVQLVLQSCRAPIKDELQDLGVVVSERLVVEETNIVIACFRNRSGGLGTGRRTGTRLSWECGAALESLLRPVRRRMSCCCCCSARRVWRLEHLSLGRAHDSVVVVRGLRRHGKGANRGTDAGLAFRPRLAAPHASPEVRVFFGRPAGLRRQLRSSCPVAARAWPPRVHHSGPAAQAHRETL